MPTPPPVPYPAPYLTMEVEFYAGDGSAVQAGEVIAVGEGDLCNIWRVDAYGSGGADENVPYEDSADVNVLHWRHIQPMAPVLAATVPTSSAPQMADGRVYRLVTCSVTLQATVFTGASFQFQVEDDIDSGNYVTVDSYSVAAQDLVSRHFALTFRVATGRRYKLVYGHATIIYSYTDV